MGEILGVPHLLSQNIILKETQPLIYGTDAFKYPNFVAISQLSSYHRQDHPEKTTLKSNSLSHSHVL